MLTVVSPGLQTTVQEHPGRTGYWAVGVPPSGAWDDLSMALANLAVGNPVGAAGLEAVVTGPDLRFDVRTTVCLTGAVTDASLDGRPVKAGVVTTVPAGGVLRVGTCGTPGMRVYVAVAGGIDVPPVLGSRATFLLGGFGGHHGRSLVAGDELRMRPRHNATTPLDVSHLLPVLTDEWTLRVIAGPHGAPGHLTPAGVAMFFETEWTVDHRCDRTGVRLVGPKPQWSRTDGGEAGLHPSNVHDNPYPVGGIMISGDTPVIVGPDGPSLGGFVVAAVVIAADQWALGQLRPGDRIRLHPVSLAEAEQAQQERHQLLVDPHFREHPAAVAHQLPAQPGDRCPTLLAELPGQGHRPGIAIHASGDQHLLLEAGPWQLDLGVRLWVHLLADALSDKGLPGVLEVVEGVRSLLVKVDTRRLTLVAVAELLGQLAVAVPDPESACLDVREVWMPIALDDPQAHEAMARYTRSVRPDAPWCPDNVEFIRRINDLDRRSSVFDIMLSATYLVLGLGDVYLGAPVAVPIDPRHRLVTTKYDPPRTWTPQNAVGIGGVYLCIYGMEGPGGYQLVGRTVPIWRLVEHDGGASAEKPWLLRPFDRLRFFPVTADELAVLRREVAAGERDLHTAPATFSLTEVRELTEQHADEIAAFTAAREAGYAGERERWAR